MDNKRKFSYGIVVSLFWVVSVLLMGSSSLQNYVGKTPQQLSGFTVGSTDIGSASWWYTNVFTPMQALIQRSNEVRNSADYNSNIQAAVDSGYTLTISPDDTVTITTALDLPGNYSIKGFGTNSYVEVNSGVVLANLTSGEDNGIIEGVYFRGDGSNRGFVLTDADNWNFYNCHFDSFTTAIKMAGTATNCNVVNCTFTNCDTNVSGVNSYNIIGGNNGLRLHSDTKTYITQYGAVGDNSTDNKAAIQTAIDAAAQTDNRTVVIPRGIFNIASTLTLRDSLKIELDGCIYLSDASDVDMMSGSNVSNIHITGSGTLDGNRDGQTVNNHNIAFLGSCSNITIDGITVKNGEDQGISFVRVTTADTCRNIRINAVTIDSCDAEALAFSCAYTWYDGVFITNCKIRTQSKAIFPYASATDNGLGGMGNVSIFNNTIEFGGVEGIDFNCRCTNVHIIFNRIIGNNGSQNQLGITGGNVGQKKNLMIFGNIITGCQTGDGIELASSCTGDEHRNLMISSNIIDSTNVGIEIGAKSTTFNGSTIKNLQINNNIISEGVGDGVHFIWSTPEDTAMTFANVTVSGNIVDADDSTGSQNGITLRNGDYSNQYLKNCIASSNVVRGYQNGIYAYSGQDYLLNNNLLFSNQYPIYVGNVTRLYYGNNLMRGNANGVNLADNNAISLGLNPDFETTNGVNRLLFTGVQDSLIWMNTLARVQVKDSIGGFVTYNGQGDTLMFRVYDDSTVDASLRGNVVWADSCVNGDFANWTGDDPDDWALGFVEDGSNYVTESSGAARFVSDNAVNVYITNCELEQGSYYKIVLTITFVSGSAGVGYEGQSHPYIDVLSTSGTYTYYYGHEAANADFMIKRQSACDFTVDDVAVYKLQY